MRILTPIFKQGCVGVSRPSQQQGLRVKQLIAQLHTKPHPADTLRRSQLGFKPELQHVCHYAASHIECDTSSWVFCTVQEVVLPYYSVVGVWRVPCCRYYRLMSTQDSRTDSSSQLTQELEAARAALAFKAVAVSWREQESEIMRLCVTQQVRKGRVGGYGLALQPLGCTCLLACLEGIYAN